MNFLAGETCSVTVFKDFIHDQDLDDSGADTDTLRADYSWSFTVATGTAPPYSADVHLTMGNPSGATPDVNNPLNYLLAKNEYVVGYNRDRGVPKTGDMISHDDFRTVLDYVRWKIGTMTAELEVVVDRSVSGEELLRMPG